MNSEEKRDTQVRQLFDRLREEESQGIPSVDSLLTRRSGPKSFFPVHRWVAGTAVAGLLVALVALPLLWDGNDAESAYTDAAEFYEWTAPTDFLLSMPGETVLHSVPSLELEEWEESGQWEEVEK